MILENICIWPPIFCLGFGMLHGLFWENMVFFSYDVIFAGTYYEYGLKFHLIRFIYVVHDLTSYVNEPQWLTYYLSPCVAETVAIHEWISWVEGHTRVEADECQVVRVGPLDSHDGHHVLLGDPRGHRLADVKHIVHKVVTLKVRRVTWKSVQRGKSYGKKRKHNITTQVTRAPH